MTKGDDFLKSQKILRLATISKSNTPHIVPVWYMYNKKKIYIGTNSRTLKVKNIKKNNHVGFCVDVGLKSPNIYGVNGQGIADLILDKTKVKKIAIKILLRYFKNMKNKSAIELLEDTDCIIEIVPKKFSIWSY